MGLRIGWWGRSGGVTFGRSGPRFYMRPGCLLVLAAVAALAVAGCFF